HRPEFALVGEGFLHPHLGQAAHELVPALLGDIGIGAKAAELGPGRRSAGADMQTAARQQGERGGALGDLDGMIELRHAHHDAMADLDALGDHGTGRQEQLGRRAVRIFLEEVVLDRPYVVEAQLVGELYLLEAVVVDRALGLARPRARHGNLVEQAELHLGASSHRRADQGPPRLRSGQATCHVEGPSLYDKPVIVEARSLDYAAFQAASLGTAQQCLMRNARLAREPAQPHHGIGGRNAMQRLSDKVAVVTGGASGMGRATVMRFLADGAKVLVADLNDKNGAETLAVAKRPGHGQRTAFVRCDVSREADVQSVVAEAEQRFGRLDIAYLNAGVGGAFGPIGETTVEDWDYTFAVLTRAIFLGMKHASLAMKKHGPN